MFKNDTLKGEYSYLLLSAKTPCMFVDKIGSLTIPKIKEYKSFLVHLEKNMKRLIHIHTQLFNTRVPVYIRMRLQRCTNDIKHIDMYNRKMLSGIDDILEKHKKLQRVLKESRSFIQKREALRNHILKKSA